MLSKILAFSLTLAIDAATGIFIFIMMLVAMNGYSESDAGWGLIAYGVLAAVVSVAAGIGSAMLAVRLIRRQFSVLLALLISIPVFSILAIALQIGCSLIGVGVAEFVRVNR